MHEHLDTERDTQHTTYNTHTHKPQISLKCHTLMPTKDMPLTPCIYTQQTLFLLHQRRRRWVLCVVCVSMWRGGGILFNTVPLWVNRNWCVSHPYVTLDTVRLSLMSLNHLQLSLSVSVSLSDIIVTCLSSDLNQLIMPPYLPPSLHLPPCTPLLFVFNFLFLIPPVQLPLSATY